PAQPKDTVLKTDGLTVVDATGQRVVDDVSLDVRAGEILGVAGVQGNGQTELVQALLGLVPPLRGSISVGGTELTGASPYECLSAGIGYVPEDRKHDGFVSTFSVAENLVLDRYRGPDFSSGVSLDLRSVQENAQTLIKEFDIRTQGP